jgi:transcriptional regulator with XRE-family HTH domain
MDTLRAWRRRKGLSQAELAERAGVDLDTVSNAETGRRQPRGSTLRKIGGAMDLTVEELFEPPPKAVSASPEEERRRADTLAWARLLRGSLEASLDALREHARGPDVEPATREELRNIEFVSRELLTTAEELRRRVEAVENRARGW